MSYFIYDLISQIYSSLGTRHHTMAANEGVTEAVASFYRGDSDTVFLDHTIYVPILYLPTFSESNA